MSESDVMIKRHYWVLACVFLLALLVRVVAVWVWGDVPVKDALQYHSIALNLVSGHGYAMVPDVPTSMRSPVYPVFLTVIYTLFGPDYHYAFYVQALLNALLVFPLFWFARRVSGSSLVGVCAAGLFAVHTSFYLVGYMYAENLIVWLGMGFVFCLYAILSGQGHRLRFSLLAGLCAGLMGLTKPEYALLGVATLLFALLWPTARAYWRIWLLVSVVSLLVVGSWQLRNFVVAPPEQKGFIKETIIFSNCPALTGEDWWYVTDMVRLEQQRAACHQLFDALPRDELVARVRDIWLEQPLTMLKLMTSRVLILWVSPPVGSSTLTGISPWLGWGGMLGQYVFVGLAMVMACAGFARRKEFFPFILLAVYMTVVYGLMHSIRRYGYPFVPELCFLFVYGVWMLRERWGKR